MLLWSNPQYANPIITWDQNLSPNISSRSLSVRCNPEWIRKFPSPSNNNRKMFVSLTLVFINWTIESMSCGSSPSESPNPGVSTTVKLFPVPIHFPDWLKYCKNDWGIILTFIITYLHQAAPHVTTTTSRAYHWLPPFSFYSTTSYHLWIKYVKIVWW